MLRCCLHKKANESKLNFQQQDISNNGARRQVDQLSIKPNLFGRHGFLLASILTKYVEVKGVLYDAPDIVAQSEKLLNDHGVTARCATGGGNFFNYVPKGRDAYIIKHIIHDWNDDQCVILLQNCREATTDGGKISVVVMVVPEGNEPSQAKFLDLQMLQYLPGCERTEKEYSELFDKAGLKLTRIIPATSPFSIIKGGLHNLILY